MLPFPKIQRGQRELTSEQLAYARSFAQEHIAAMLSTADIDEWEVKRYLWSVYQGAGLRPPFQTCWFDSPFAFVWAAVETNAQDSIWDRLHWRVPIRVEMLVHLDVWKNVREEIQKTALVQHIVQNAVWESVQAHSKANLWERIKAGVRGRTRTRAWKRLKVCACAYNNAKELAWYQFFHETFEENELSPLARLNEMLNGYYLGKQEAWLVRKPIILQLDAVGRLHSNEGMATQYRDGWGFYAWHGVRVPEKVIMHPEQLTTKDWVKERNAEVRRVILERLGLEQFIEQIGELTDRGRRGNLIRVDLGHDAPERFAHYVQVRDSSTERQYCLRVPPSVTRTDEAIAWTFGLTEEEYQPQQET